MLGTNCTAIVGDEVVGTLLLGLGDTVGNDVSMPFSSDDGDAMGFSVGTLVSILLVGTADIIGCL